jgi:hypothetical protein
MSRSALVTLLAVIAVPALADDKPKQPANAEAAMMEAWEKHATPGQPHKHLAALAGDWTYDAKFWVAPGAPPMEMKGTAKRTMIMGGRFLQDDVAGPAQGGMPPFQGFGLTGYDNHLKKYVATWVDSMTTSIMQSTGEASADGKTITMHHEDFDPMVNQKVKARDVTRITGPDTNITEFYKTTPDGKEMKAGEITFKRSKK